jgi:hypothetical protein
MPDINADQMIFTRVERSWSPRSFAGYQTVHRSSGIDDTTMKAVESVIQTLPQTAQARSVGERRRQFFRVNTDHFVIAHTTVIDPHPEITDRNRRGAFLVHCVLVPSDTFTWLRDNPFEIFDQVSFVSSAEEMRDRFGQCQERIEPLKLRPGGEYRRNDADWSDQARALYELAFKASDLMKAGERVQLTGPEEAVFQTLRVLFYLCPNGRRHLTFDTLTDGRTMRPETFWAIGLPENESRSRTSSPTIDCSNHKVVRGAADVTLPKDPQHLWLDQALNEQPLDQVAELAEDVQRVAEAIKLGKSPLGKPINPRAYRELYRTAPEFIDKAFHSRIRAMVSEDVSLKFSTFLCELIRRTPQEIPDFVEAAIDPHSRSRPLAKWFTTWIKTSGYRLARNDWNHLHAVARAADNLVLEFWCAAHRSPADKATAIAVLDRMTGGQFEESLARLAHGIDLQMFVCRTHAELLGTCLDLKTLSDGRFVALVSAIAELNGGSALKSWAGRVSSLSKGKLEQLQILIEKHRDCAMLFRHEVDQACRKIAESPAWYKRWLPGSH